MQYWLPGSRVHVRILCVTQSSRFRRARQMAQYQKLSKNFPTKKAHYCNTHDQGKRYWPGLKDLALSWWIGLRFFDVGEICELRLHTVTCLASLYVGKQHWTNNEPQNRIKWRWIIEPKLQRKGNLQLAQVYIISIFVPVFLHFNNYIEFFIQSL